MKRKRLDLALLGLGAAQISGASWLAPACPRNAPDDRRESENGNLFDVKRPPARRQPRAQGTS